MVGLGALAACLGQSSPAVIDVPRDVMQRVALAETRRDALVDKVRSIRQYVLRNPRWQSAATMDVLVVSGSTGKRVEVLRMDAVGMQKRILQKLLDGEIAAARKQGEGEITPAHYDVQALPDEPCKGRSCRVFTLLPKEKNKYLFDGRAWIDPAEDAVVRMEGRTAKNVSFWIGRPYVIQEFRKVGQHWLATRHDSISDVKIFGRTELTIHYNDYALLLKTGETVTSCASTCDPRL